MSETTLPATTLHQIAARLREANRATAARYPGDSIERQPVHTVYGGAHLFTADIAPKMGAAALKALHDYAPDADALAYALDIDPDMAARIRPLIVEKLTREPVEDFRIDFEDGFGHRSEDEEDRYARSAAEQVAEGMVRHSLPPGIGLRIKALSEELQRRSLRTLDL